MTCVFHIWNNCISFAAHRVYLYGSAMISAIFASPNNCICQQWSKDCFLEWVPFGSQTSGSGRVGITTVKQGLVWCTEGNYILMEWLGQLNHWGWVRHICISRLTIIGSDNGLSPGWPQAIFWSNVQILLIGPLGTDFSEILIEIHIFSFGKMHLIMSSGKWQLLYLNLNVWRNLVVGNIKLIWPVIVSNHDDVIKWKDFPCNWPFVWGIRRSRRIPSTKVSEAELWCFLRSLPELTIE